MRFLVLSLVLLLSLISIPVSADAGVAVTLTTTVIGSGGSNGNGGGTYYGGGTRYIDPVRNRIETEGTPSGSSYIPPQAPPVYISPPVGTTIYSSTGSSVQQNTLPSPTLINENFKWGEFWVVIFWAVMAGCTIAVIYYIWRKRKESIR